MSTSLSTNPLRPVSALLLAALAGSAAAAVAPQDEPRRGLQAVDPGVEVPIRLVDHAVEVVIHNGFADVLVAQTFRNPNPADLEAVYRLPLPERAVLSEISIRRGEETVQHGEVVARDRARQVYESERQQGNDAGLAETDEYRWFTFRFTNIPAAGEVTIRHRYYQPLELDHGVGRFVYPREPGGTEDPAARAFWDDNVDAGGHRFRFACELKSAWPVRELRLPGHHDRATIEQPGEGRWTARFEEPSSALRDVVVYYRLADDLPGRVELIPYRPSADEPGYFMMVLTPGLDLQPRLDGVDYTFVLDTSGSMSAKLGTLADGVRRALGRLNPTDRFRLVTFSTDAREIQGLTPATPEQVRAAIERVAGLQSSGSTNLHDGLRLGLRKLDDDRAACVVLVTDGVANTGVIEPKAFHELSRKHDVRVFGFLMGNSSNWPLMEIVCDASGGFYQSVSNQDDIVGQILLAKEKMVHESLHDAELTIRGVRTFDTTDGMLGKIYHGEQLVIFGRYAGGGRATLTLDARLTGQDRTYATTIDFPEIATDHPELERLWAMNRVEDLQRRRMIDEVTPEEAGDAIRDLGVSYQIVNDETAMLILDDAAFQRHGIDRANRERVAREEAARRQRAQQAAVPSRRVDAQQPMWNRPANGLNGGRSRGSGSGSGSVGPWFLLPLLAMLLAARRVRRPTAA